MAETSSSSAQDPVTGTTQHQTTSTSSPFPLPRVTIRFCTQCKWMLRAAYFAQELLSTFSTALGEVALQPSTGGTFVVTIEYQQEPSSSSADATPATRTLWDRKVDGGFPETKELKRRVRDVIEPGRDLGHVDRDHKRPAPSTADSTGAMASSQGGTQPPGPRWPASTSTSTSAPAQQQQPQAGQDNSGSGENPDRPRRGYSRPMIPADDGPAPSGDVYQPQMKAGGNMPLVRPPGEAANAEIRAKLEASAKAKADKCEEKCEDCE